MNWKYATLLDITAANLIIQDVWDNSSYVGLSSEDMYGILWMLTQYSRLSWMLQQMGRGEGEARGEPNGS